jgi:hypothetical protein
VGVPARRVTNRSLPYSAVAGVLATSSVVLLYEKVEAVELSAAMAGEAKTAAKRAAVLKKRPAIVAGARKCMRLSSRMSKTRVICLELDFAVQGRSSGMV